MQLSAHNLAARYIAFAVIATLANFLGQAAVLSFVKISFGLEISVASGTIIGFLVKYVLDKKFIFFNQVESAAQESAQIMLYGFTAIFTTLLFWSFELGAVAVWHNAAAKYSGATVGLAIGYCAKFLLDRKFVFCRAS